MKEFNKKGFPIIRMHDDYFEIKAIDYWEYRKFDYSEIVKFKYGNDSGSWWFWPVFQALHSKYEPFKLVIYKQNGADWTYNTTTQYDKEFAEIIGALTRKCKNSR